MRTARGLRRPPARASRRRPRRRSGAGAAGSAFRARCALRVHHDQPVEQGVEHVAQIERHDLRRLGEPAKKTRGRASRQSSSFVSSAAWRRRRCPQALRVGGHVIFRLFARPAVVEAGAHQLDVTLDGGESLGWEGGGATWPRPLEHLLEDPGIALARADHHAPRRCRRASRRRHRVDESPLASTGVPAPLRPPADRVAVRDARVELRARAPVHREQLGALFHRQARELRRDQLALVPADAHLDRQRSAEAAAHRAHDRGGARQVAQQRRARAVANELLDRAADVEVDPDGALALELAAGLAEDLGLGAEELEGAGRLARRVRSRRRRFGPPLRVLGDPASVRQRAPACFAISRKGRFETPGIGARPGVLQRVPARAMGGGRPGRRRQARGKSGMGGREVGSAPIATGDLPKPWASSGPI